MNTNYEKFLAHLQEVEEQSKVIQNEDEYWKQLILEVLLACYASQKDIIKTELVAFNGKGKIEDFIRDEFYKWILDTKKFARNEDKMKLIINHEVGASSHKEGYYDLKFQHSDWNNGDTYYTFECKCIKFPKNPENPVSIQEYIYHPKSKKGKDDGGVYRYVISKYAHKFNFGGMIGFILSGNETTIIDYICTQLEKFELPPDQTGKLRAPIKRNAIENNPNTFESIHIRRNAANEITSSISLLHIMMDFS